MYIREAILIGILSMLIRTDGLKAENGNGRHKLSINHCKTPKELNTGLPKECWNCKTR